MAACHRDKQNEDRQEANGAKSGKCNAMWQAGQKMADEGNGWKCELKNISIGSREGPQTIQGRRRWKKTGKGGFV